MIVLNRLLLTLA